MSNVNEKKITVATNVEIAGIFLIFLAIFVILYPQNDIEEQVMKESSNYDLTVAYLENMLRHDPENRKLLLTLIRTAERSGKVDLGLKVLDILKNTDDPRLREETKRIRYGLLKNEYIIAKPQLQKELRAKLRTLMTEISMQDFDNLNDIAHWYREANWIDDEKAALNLAKNAVEKFPENIYWNKQLMSIANLVGDSKSEKIAIDNLLKTDMGNREEILGNAYRKAIEMKDFERADKILAKLEKTSLKWREEKARQLLQERSYRKASNTYVEMMEEAKEKNMKKKWLLKALESLQYGNLMQDASSLSKKYEDDYIDDQSMVRIFLKIYLAAADLDAASALSIKVLKRERDKQNE